jgi:SagB-type dehydrogenase family enzyme
VSRTGVTADVHAYHDGSKHHFHRFARSLGYLDWASQPNPFRSFAGEPEVPLSPRPDAPVTIVGDVLRHALGLSAWKQFGASRWSLRVNPSSGNLHPTEAYVIAGAAPGLGDAPGVYHYAPDRHALEPRCRFDRDAWPAAVAEPDSWLVALTSIHWREAWKYGERAFRYCQHDLGHAIGAIAIAAANAGLHAALLPDWSHADIAALTGIDRDEDFIEAEREEPGCLIAVSLPRRSAEARRRVVSRETLLAAVRAGTWTGRASQLSEDHTTWTFIDQVAAATRDPGRSDLPGLPALPALPGGGGAYSAAVILQRRSAVAFDGVSAIDREAFLAMLSRVMPAAAPPWDALWWDARVLEATPPGPLAPGQHIEAKAKGPFRTLERRRSSSPRSRSRYGTTRSTRSG